MADGPPRHFADAARQLAGQAITLLGWAPDTYWAATPEDVAIALDALSGRGAAVPVEPEMLARLKEQFPDG